MARLDQPRCAGRLGSGQTEQPVHDIREGAFAPPHLTAGAKAHAGRVGGALDPQRVDNGPRPEALPCDPHDLNLTVIPVVFERPANLDQVVQPSQVGKRHQQFLRGHS